MARKAAKKKTSAKKATKKAAGKPAKKAAKASKKAVSKKAPAKKAAKQAQPKAAAPKPVKAAPKPVKNRKAEKPKNGNSLSYTQSEFIENIRSFCGLDKRSDAREMWEDISLFIQDSLKRGYRVPLVGLGKMYVRKSKARMGRNPATGEQIHIPARKRVRFTAAKALKDQVL